MPSNKRLLTPTFVLLATGTALAVFCVAYLLVDAGGPSRPSGAQQRRLEWNRPLVALGRNALVVFVLERFLLQTAKHVHIGDRSIEARLLDVLPFGEPGVHLAYTAALLLVVVAVVSGLHRSRLYLAL